MQRPTKSYRLERDDGIPPFRIDALPDARAQQKIDPPQIENGEVSAIGHVAQHIEVVGPHAKRRDAGVEDMQSLTTPAKQERKAQTQQ